VYKHIFAGGALDKPISLCSVKPLHNALLFHERLLSPLLMWLMWRPAITPENTKSCRRHRRRAAHDFQHSLRNSKTRTSKTAFQIRASRGPTPASCVLLLWQETLLSATQNCVTATFQQPCRPSDHPLWGVELPPRVATIGKRSHPPCRC
jgi:hypothetical protein